MAKLKTILVSGLLVIFTIGGTFFSPTPVEGDELGISLPGGQWFTIDKFDGYQTKADPSKVTDGANPQGQNTSINDGDRITVRDVGYELFPSGTASTTQNP